MTSGLRVLIADDHALLRKGLISALDDLGEEVEVCYEAENADQVMDALSMEPDLDLILLDLLMPGAKGFELLSKVCGESPGVPVVVLSATEDTGHMRKALDCGASGFICKSAGHELMLSALGLVLAGGVYVPAELLQAQADPPKAEIRPATDPQGTHSLQSLTERQREVFKLLSQGRSNKQIARELRISQNTVKIHVAAILRKLAAANRTEAVALGRELSFDLGEPSLPG
jgi:DNA-binding NarL/FixJ family response regulator